ncbi:Wadjet anti-phage system protein JetD domain-containing protein [Serratia sp. D1N4]
MNSPSDISRKLARQWYKASIRSERLLKPGCWPLHVPIGKPSAKAFAESAQCVQRHVQAWRQVSIGNVEWEPVSYRASLTPVLIPVRWVLYQPSDWIKAASDPQVSQEFKQLEHIVERVDTLFHPLLISQRSLWQQKSLAEVIAAVELATRLTPGCAKGRPLRLLADQGVDTKFFERNAPLLTKLLDERFAGEASEQGLTAFLDALDENNHWVLVTPLAPGLLPFKKIKITTAELAEVTLPATRILVVENEHCIHQLPELPDTIAILGAGLDLQWLASPWLAEKSVGYWGDMDTWGLLMLARVRGYYPAIHVLLMNRMLFERFASSSAVVEPVTAQDTAPEGLLRDEGEFYRYLLMQKRGRLEQEFLPAEVVIATLNEWGKVGTADIQTETL